MVGPINRQPPPATPSTVSTNRLSSKGDVPKDLSAADAQALQKTSQREPRLHGNGQGVRGADRSSAATSTPRARPSRPGLLLPGIDKTSRAFSLSPNRFDVRSMGTGTKVVSSDGGRVLSNLRGPLAKDIAERLASTMPKSERPTLWLKENYGNIPIHAIQKYLDEMISPDKGGAIAIRKDGMMEVRRQGDYQNGDTLFIERTSVDDGNSPGDSPSPVLRQLDMNIGTAKTPELSDGAKNEGQA